MPSSDDLIHWEQYKTFCKGQVKYGDTDAHVSLFGALSKEMDLTQEEKLWLGLLFMAYYHDGSCWAAFRDPKIRARKRMPPLNYPISYQRRNLFGGRIERHLRELMEKPSLTDWLDVSSWEKLIKRLKGLYGNGRWASYTTAELLVKTGGVTVKPDTYEIAGSSGPAQGLEFLGLEPTEKNARWVARHVGVEASTEVLESVLCNWSRMCKSDFYLGHNIDRQQGRLLLGEKVSGVKFGRPWKVRKKVFDNRCLGEIHGWPGVDKKRKKIYMKIFEVLQPWEDRNVVHSS